MKHVVKGVPPAQFEEWKARANDDWQPSYAALQNPEKRALHMALLAEQGGVCCYCGREIGLDDSHIEHFRPQEQREDLALDHGNLLASCIRASAPGAPLHCGHAKGRHFDEMSHISPLDPTCEARFRYALNGAVLPSEAGDVQAACMIDLLRLDLDFLRNRRGDALQRVFDPAFLDSATDAELQALATAFRARDGNGMLESFGHVLARFAEQLST